MKKTIKNKVLWVLEEYPELRDLKLQTCVKIWSLEMKKLHTEIKPTVEIFMEDLLNKRLSNPNTIARWWLKWQTDRPELRGALYNYRHDIEEPAVREIMKEIA